MNNFLIQTILAAGNGEGEDTLWMQILVLVILAGGFGIFSIIKAKANKSKEHEQYYPQQSRYRRQWQFQPILEHGESSPSISIEESNSNKPEKTKQSAVDFPAPAVAVKTKSERNLTKTKKDLHSGMELLELNFLLSIVENIKGEDEQDIVIRKLNFKELIRRGKLNEADSKAIRIYAINKDNRYGKDIQCEAMKNLAQRTAARSKK